jgi:hypothetical protein
MACCCFGGSALAAPPSAGARARAPPAASSEDIIFGGAACRRLSLSDLPRPQLSTGPSAVGGRAPSGAAASRQSLGSRQSGLSIASAARRRAGASITYSAPPASFTSTPTHQTPPWTGDNPLRRISLPLRGATPRSSEELQGLRDTFGGLEGLAAAAARPS